MRRPSSTQKRMSCSMARQCGWPARAMSKRWPVAGKSRAMSGVHHPRMHARFVDGVIVRPLRNGDTATVSALFERLGDRSRERRFCGAKPWLSELELANLARVDADHHVLV